MKKLLSIWLLFLSASAFGATFNSITCTFTNIPTNGCTFVIDGTTVRWTNPPLNNTAWIQTNGLAGSATNLMRRLGAQWPQYRTYQTNSTNVVIEGSGLQFSIAGNYGFTTTNALGNNTNRWIPVLPFDYSFETNRTNTADELIYGINKYARTNTFSQGAQALTNFVSRTNAQIVQHKVLENSTLRNSVVTNTPITNASYVHATNVIAGTLTSTNGQLNNTSVTNAPWIHSDSNRFTTVIVSGSAVITNLSAPGTGTASEKLGSGTVASGAQSFAAGANAQATSNSAVAVGNGAQAQNPNAVAIGAASSAGGTNSIALGQNTSASGTSGIAIGTDSTADYLNAVAIGDTVLASGANEFALGNGSHIINFRGALRGQGPTSSSNIVMSRQSGPMTFDEGTYTSLVGGSNNNVQLSTNVWTTLSGNNAACDIAALRTADGLPMAGPLGTGGRRVGIKNGSAFAITLLHASGFETQATNRFALESASYALQPGARLELVYDVSVSRWTPASPLSASATNLSLSSGSLATNTASIAFVDTNLTSGVFYTNFAQRGFVQAAIALTNVLAADVSAMALWIDRDGDGTWDKTNGPVRLNGTATSAGSAQLFGWLPPNARFVFTNQSAGASPSATILSGSCEWSRY